MTVNLTKTQISGFNERFVGSNRNALIFNKKDISIGNGHNYLGAIFFSQKDRFREYYEYEHRKVLRAMYDSRILVHNGIGPDVSSTSLFRIFETQIQPIIDYGSEVSHDHKTTPRLESLHTTNRKRALAMKMHTSSLVIWGETETILISSNAGKFILFYWLKIKTTPLTNPLRIVYEELYRLSNADDVTWYAFVHELLVTIRLENIWIWTFSTRS